MYVDKRLAGVHCVQTLSRLNRTTAGKSETVVLDFVNEAETTQQSFQDYYQTVLLEEKTDPNKLYDLQSQLEEFEIYTGQDVNEFAEVFFNPAEPQEKLQPILDRVVISWNYKLEDERENFKSILQSFIRLYGFISQVITFEDVDLEKLYVFSKNLNRKLPKREGSLPYEVQDAVDLDSFRIQQTFKGQIELEEKNGKPPGIGSGVSPRQTEEDRDLLSHIIQTLNNTFGADLTEEDKVDIERIKVKLEENEELQAVMIPENTLENIRIKFDSVVDSLLLDFVHTKIDLYKKLTEPQVNTTFKQRWFEGYQKEFGRRRVAGV